MTRSAALLAILLLILSESVFAGEAVEREYSFSTSDPDGKYAEHKVISIEGKKYKAVDWDYTTTGSTPNVVKKKYKNLTHESVPESLTKDGEEYTLEDADYREKSYTRRFPADGSDSAPPGRDITVKGKTVRAQLSDVRLCSAGDTSVFTIPAIYYGDKDVDYYVWESRKIPAEEAPYFVGYENEVLSYLGLDASLNTITAISWSSGYYKTPDGQTARNAVFTGLRKSAASYEAVYEATLYDASATYTNGLAGDYTYDRTVRVTYEPVGLSLLQKIGIAAGIALAALTLAGILYFLAKRRREEKN